MSSKSKSQILKILFQTENINIFILRGVIFSRYVQLRNSFSDEKGISGKIWDILLQRSYQNLTWQSIKWNFLHWQKVELCKVVHNAKKHFKENIIRYSRDAYSFQCGWSVYDNVGWKYDRIVVGWAGECCGEPS